MIIDRSGEVMGKLQEGVCFDDVLLIPQYSAIESRGDIDIGSELGGHHFSLPIISSPMDTVTGGEMAAELFDCGGLGIIHRYNTIDAQQKHVEETYDLLAQTFLGDAEHFDPIIGVAIGVSDDYIDRAQACVDAGARVLCIDVAHGHHTLVKSALKQLKDIYGTQAVHVMAGNVATLDAFNDLADWGADSIRVGVGGGSICSTRIQTGHGVPTLQSILDCAQSDREALLVADGGIKTAGDITKCLAAGADFVMLGSLLGATDQSPGELFTSAQGTQYKVYRGMASKEAQMDWRGNTSSLEGVSTTIPYKGSAAFILGELHRAIRSGFSYTGATNLSEFQARAKFIRQTNAGQIESSTHILRR